MEQNNSSVKVYYDGGCPLCSKEIEMYRKKDKECRLQLVDINSKDFNAVSEGLDPKKVHKYFHVKLQNGKIVTGVEAFLAIWKALKIFRFLQICAQFLPTRKLMDLGYLSFAKVRPFLPRKKDCGHGQCHI